MKCLNLLFCVCVVVGFHLSSTVRSSVQFAVFNANIALQNFPFNPCTIQLSGTSCVYTATAVRGNNGHFAEINAIFVTVTANRNVSQVRKFWSVVIIYDLLW